MVDALVVDALVVDALVVDACGRAVLFASARRRGWPPTCPGYSGSCGQVLGPHAPVLLGFDRGGSYPCVFTTCQDPGADWVSYRRAPLAAATANPTAATITGGGEQVQVMLAEQTVQIKDYGPARRLTLFEHDLPVLQVLTSDTTVTG